MRHIGEHSLAAEVLRKAIHLGTAVLPVVWAYDGLTTAQIRHVLSLAVAIALTVEFVRHRGGGIGRRFNGWIDPLLRPHERLGITGATWLALGMAIVVWLTPRESAIIALWAAAVGDAVAALVGRTVQCLRGTNGAGKTVVGSVGAAVATMVGALWLTPASSAVAAVLGLAAAVAERPTRLGDDNLRIVAVVAVTAMALGLR